MNEQRGANIKLFGPDRVRQFCVRNDIEVIVTPSWPHTHGHPQWDTTGWGERSSAECTPEGRHARTQGLVDEGQLRLEYSASARGCSDADPCSVWGCPPRARFSRVRADHRRCARTSA